MSLMINMYIVLTWLFVVCGAVDGQSTGIKEYCHMEAFTAHCPKGKVILMEHAEYGRMRRGRCLKTDYSVGCRVDVMEQLDRKCSGRRNCTVPIPDPELFSVQSCRSDLLAYLEASYTCIQALELSVSTCPDGQLSVHRDSGYLVARSPPIDVCTVSIHVKRGQQINVTLFDLTKGSSMTELPSTSCMRYASVREEGLVPGYLQICHKSHNTRQVAVYTSVSDHLNISVLSGRPSTPSLFMIHFKAVGCPDIAPPPMSYTHRDKEKLEVTCNETNEKWHLVCKDNTWVGRYGNCSISKARGGVYKINNLNKNNKNDRREDLPIGLLVAITLGVLLGVFAGFIFLLLGFFCRKTILQNHQQARSGLLSNHDVHGNTYKMVDVDIPQGEEPCYFCHQDNSIYTKSALDVPVQPTLCRQSHFAPVSPYVTSTCGRECKLTNMETGDYERPVTNSDEQVYHTGNHSNECDNESNACLPARVQSTMPHLQVNKLPNTAHDTVITSGNNVAKVTGDNKGSSNSALGFKQSEISNLEDKLNNVGHKTMMERFPLPSVTSYS